MTTTPTTMTRLLQTDRADVQPLTKGGSTKFSAKAGQSYRVVMPTGKTGADAYAQADDVIATRKGQALHLSYPDKTEAVFDNFFEACAQDQCTVELPGDDRGLYKLTGGSPEGVAAGADGQVLYAHGSDQTVVNLLKGQGVAYDGGQLAGLETAAGHSTYIPASNAAAALPWVAGGLLAAGGIAAAAGGGGGGGSDNHQAGNNDRDPGNNPGGDPGNNPGNNPGGNEEPAVTSTLVGQFTGPVIAGHGLSATAYAADGTQLGATVAINDNGSFTVAIDPAYTGTVLVRVTDSSAGADYREAATNTDADLTADLRAATVVTGPGEHHVNVNLMTEAAVRALGLTGGDAGSSATTLGTVSAETVGQANLFVGYLLGLREDPAGGSTTPDMVTGAVPQTLINADGSPNAAVNDYGRLLAALSGAQVGTSTEDVLAVISRPLHDGGLAPAALTTLIQGASLVEGSQGGATLIDQISNITYGMVSNTNSASPTINVVATDNIVSGAEAAAGVTLSGTAPAGAPVNIEWGTFSGAVTADGNGDWSVIVAQANVPADGATAIIATLPNGDGAHASRGVYIDTTGPAAPSAPVDYQDNVGGSQGAHQTVVFTDDATPGINVGAGLPYTPVLFVDGVKVNSTYDSALGTLTPDTALADGQHAFTYANTDSLGNEGAQSPPLYITTLADTLAAHPTATMAAGTDGSDLLSSPNSPSIIVGGGGDDTIDSDHVSALYGGEGNDRFEIGSNLINALDVASPPDGDGVAAGDDLSRIHGNGGTDTIAFSADGVTLHLPSILETGPVFGISPDPEAANRITSIEIIDLRSPGGPVSSNKLLLASVDLRLITDEAPDGSHTLRVVSDNGGVVDIADAADTDGWTLAGQTTEGSITYNIWNHDTSDTHLLVQTGITVI